MSDIKNDDEPKKINASDHDIYGVTTIVSLLIPLAGIILGIVYLSKKTRVDHKLGEHLIAIGILSSIVMTVIWFTCFAPSVIVPINTTTQFPTESWTTNPSVPKWDIDSGYAKITKGMTKSAVESAIGKTASNCSESEQSESSDKYAACTYGGGTSDSGIIIVNYVNDIVTTTEKVKY